MAGPPLTLLVTACDCTTALHCDAPSASLVSAAFGALLSSPSHEPCHHYRIQCGADGAFTVSDDRTSASFTDADAFLFYVDKVLTLTLQRLRADLLFVHAAVVAAHGRAAVLPATAGTGKSTLTLAAVSRGFSYSSDELAPIDLATCAVSPYPRALTLKAPPPNGGTLPAGTLRLERRFLVPAAALPGPTQHTAAEIAAVIFLRRDDGAKGLHRISPASAAARLMQNVLNGLAHGNAGLTAAALVSERVPAFDLQIADTAAAVEAIESVLAGAQPS